MNRRNFFGLMGKAAVVAATGAAVAVTTTEATATGFQTDYTDEEIMKIGAKLAKELIRRSRAL